ncbi:FAD-dependent monooxygenase [Kocuria sp. LUK]|uniref:FAD-dependent monooxygenase n=1 Tax=Kocuria sp. LUK TaxID=2897828 RepID=UPI001E2B54F9|nr:FAD-dependent monooxygenase [Kocuria sp. LUK]MCD1146458.1 FAD-dependent monooxygenase [Kocuria sp. LUK]
MAGDGGILVVGAGTSGLALALQADAHGAAVRVVERRERLRRPSRALILHPRTLEGLRPLGVTEAVLARADRSPVVDLHLGRRVVTARLEDVRLPGTAFPHPVLVRQADVEEVLREALAARGVPVERGTALTGLAGRTAVLERAGTRERAPFRFLAGCDGPDSTARALTGVPWRGRPYRADILLADLELDGLAPDRAHVVAAAGGIVFLFAIGEAAPWRLLVSAPARPSAVPFGQPGPPVPVEELRAALTAAGLPARITRVAWSARVRLQRRLAERFRAGDVFLVGDAAHAHSPAGGQGMNTGIQDALNLGWKLAWAAAPGAGGAARERLLESYELERRPADRRVLALTDVLFRGEAGTDAVSRLARTRLAPLGAPALPAVLRTRFLVDPPLAVLAQLRVHHRASPLSVTRGRPRGRPRAGERLPDGPVRCGGRTVRLHELTAAPGVHVLLERSAVDPGPLGPGVHVHRLEDRPGRGGTVVRPDGWVGLRADPLEAAGLSAWLAAARGRP